MDDDHKLVHHKIDDEHFFWELTKIGAVSSPLEKMIGDKRSRGIAVNLINQIKRILDYGIEASCKTNKLRKINQVQGLYEIKGYSGVKRGMAYILCRKPPEVVLLFQFDGHQGAGNIHKEIDKAQPLALAASVLLGKELSDMDEGKQENGSL